MRKVLILTLLLLAVVACSKDEDNVLTGPGVGFQVPTSPVSEWTYIDSTYTYESGIANKYDVDNQDQVIDGITVLLFNKNVACTASPVDMDVLTGAWIAVQFPDIATRKYAQVEIRCVMGKRTPSGSASKTFGMFGIAGLSLVDLDGEMRVRGWFDINDEYLAIPTHEMSARGTFDVPYCPPPG